MATISLPDGSQQVADQTRSGSSQQQLFVHRMRKGCSSIDIWLQNASHGIQNHVVWKTLIVLFIIVLLFGPPCQIWFLPVAADVAMNTLYFTGFVIFAVDMIFHCYLDPTYFRLVSCNRRDERNKATAYADQGPCFLGSVGSFMFWCDFASTICFLLEIDLIYKRRFESITYTIPLNRFGFPDPGSFSKATYTNHPFYWHGDDGLVILIFKALRVARLVPSTRVVELSTKLNVFWYLVRLSPSYYWKLMRKRRAGAKRNKQNPTIARSKWGGLEIAAVATVKSRKEREKSMKQKGNIVYANYRLNKGVEKSLRFLHILPDSKIELNRHIAATRIQRAWRNCYGKYGGVSFRPEEDGGSHAWKKEDGGSHNWKSLPDVNSPNQLADIQSRTSRWSDSVHRPSKESASADPKNDRREKGRLSRRQQMKTGPSQVGTAMAEVTGRTVALFLLLNLLLALLFTYTELDTTSPSTMVILHGQTTSQSTEFAWKAVDTARRSTIPNLYSYSAASRRNDINFTWTFGRIPEKRPLNTKNITIVDERGGSSTGLFNVEAQVNQKAMMEMILLVCILLVWFFGVAAFAGPIMTLVVNPIERALKLLNMLVMDPLGYQNSLQYKNFLTEPDKIAESGLWSKDVLKGMETEFLMSTIVRIGSLMKVGFGSAGVKIIRNNLQKDGNTGAVILSSQGSRVSCIFMFCDIRSFTDATECLQEEVFVFTNQIAAVVHSICNSYSGSTNKNIGDAFLVSWKLDDGPTGTKKFGNAKAKRYQADKALLSVVKISIALHHNDFYVELLSNHAKKALMDKFKDRPGPIVQLGFGLHAGKAIEGAIGSQRKIDATYVSMAVETAEYLETSTKKYNVNMLMSCSFHRLLRASRRQRCRKIDRIMFQDDDDDDEDDEFREEVVSSRGKVMELFTYDIDVNALFDHAESDDDNDEDNDEEEPIDTPFDDQLFGSFRRLSTSAKRGSKRSLRASRSTKGEPPKQEQEPKTKANTPELVLPTGPALYSENIWLQEDLRRMRRRYTTKFFDTYNLGLKKYYSEDWDEARAHFEANLNQFEDGPSRYFLNEITKYDGTPPENFKPYGRG